VGGEKQRVPDVFILTRFAIRPDRELDKFVRKLPTVNPWQDEQWLEDRLEIFRQVALGSIKNQSDKEFSWLIGIDADAPRRVRDELRQLVEGHGRLVLTSVRQDFAAKTSKIVTGESDFHCTVRLDSDDALRENFVARVKRVARQTGFFYNFPYGVSLHADGLLTHRHIRSSPFLFYVSSSPEHVLSFGSHAEVSNHHRLLEVQTFQPMWLKIHHPLISSPPPPAHFPVFQTDRQRITNAYGVALELIGTSVTTGQKIRVVWSWLGKLLGRSFPLVEQLWRLRTNRRRH